MEMTYRKGDLFTAGDEYFLAHCISADFALGAGIAKQFTARLDIRSRLKSEYGDIPMGGQSGQDTCSGKCFQSGHKGEVFSQTNL